jgi:hypothetical protein
MVKIRENHDCRKDLEVSNGVATHTVLSQLSAFPHTFPDVLLGCWVLMVSPMPERDAELSGERR